MHCLYTVNQHQQLSGLQYFVPRLSIANMYCVSHPRFAAAAGFLHVTSILKFTIPMDPLICIITMYITMIPWYTQIIQYNHCRSYMYILASTYVHACALHIHQYARERPQNSTHILTDIRSPIYTDY